MEIGETLKLDIEAYAENLKASHQLFRRARTGELTPAAIATYLVNVRFLVAHTDVNLRLARERAAELGRFELAEFFEQKRKEEDGHYRWADSDMDAMSAMFGVKPNAGPAQSIAALLDYLRVMIVEEPTNYLAYILFVEYLTVLLGPEWLRLLEERCGIPTSAMTVVGNHIELDKDHVVEGVREINHLVGAGHPLEPLQGALRASMRFFDGFCSEISAIAN